MSAARPANHPRPVEIMTLQGVVLMGRGSPRAEHARRRRTGTELVGLVTEDSSRPKASTRRADGWSSGRGPLPALGEPPHHLGWLPSPWRCPCMTSRAVQRTLVQRWRSPDQSQGLGALLGDLGFPQWKGNEADSSSQRGVRIPMAATEETLAMAPVRKSDRQTENRTPIRTVSPRHHAQDRRVGHPGGFVHLEPCLQDIASSDSTSSRGLLPTFKGPLHDQPRSCMSSISGSFLLSYDQDLRTASSNICLKLTEAVG